MSSSLMQRIALKALETFSKFTSKQTYPQHLEALQRMLSEVSSNDLNFDPDLVADTGDIQKDDTNREAPVAYVHLWEDSVFTMGVFVLKRGVSLPLHDHPGMTGLIKVIYGRAAVKSFTPRQEANIPKELLNDLSPWQRKTVKEVEQHPVKELSSESGAILLTPTESNFHEISAVDGPTAFLDILAPPYDHFTGDRVCRYYKLHEGEGKDSPKYLFEILQPRDFWCSQSEYLGPEIDPYAEL